MVPLLDCLFLEFKDVALLVETSHSVEFLLFHLLLDFLLQLQELVDLESDLDLILIKCLYLCLPALELLPELLLPSPFLPFQLLLSLQLDTRDYFRMFRLKVSLI